MTVVVPVAYMPLLDAAPLVIANELGFADAEGLTLDLRRAPSWSSVRDMLVFGQVSAAHLLSPVPVAMALGLGSVHVPLSAVSVLSVNGTVVCVGPKLDARLQGIGHSFDLGDPVGLANDLAAVSGDSLTFGVPFSFSMHTELLRYWIAGTALTSKTITIRTIPPPLMADALMSGEVDACCVGEPWGSVAVEQNAGAIVLPGARIWSAAPEKVLAVRTDWADAEPDVTGRLMRALWHAGRWLESDAARTTASALLSRPEYLNVPAELIDRGLTGTLLSTSRGELRQVPHFLRFHTGTATFPWRSQADWIARRLAKRHGLSAAAAHRAAGVFRSDLYRQHIGPTGAVLPQTSAKPEGAILASTVAPAQIGQVTLAADTFFDGRIFDHEADDLPQK